MRFVGGVCRSSYGRQTTQEAAVLPRSETAEEAGGARVNWTEKLKEILSWIASHSQRLSRKGLELPNHLAGAQVYFCQDDSDEPQTVYADEGLTIAHTHPIMLSARGQLDSHLNQCWLKADSKYRVQVRDSDNILLFTEDHIHT